MSTRTNAIVPPNIFLATTQKEKREIKHSKGRQTGKKENKIHGDTLTLNSHTNSKYGLHFEVLLS